MKQLQAQIRDACPKCQQHFGQYFLPYGDESIDTAKGYKPNQIVNMKVAGIRKERSMAQLGTYFACCKLTADNTDDPQWNTKDKTDFQCRVGLDFRDPNVLAVRPDGTVVFQYLSISFPNLEHIEACRYFDRALEFMAAFLGLKSEKRTVDGEVIEITPAEVLVENAKAQMQRY